MHSWHEQSAACPGARGERILLCLVLTTPCPAPLQWICVRQQKCEYCVLGQLFLFPEGQSDLSWGLFCVLCCEL